QLIYQSSATVAITPHQLQLVLPAWRAHNHAAGISGLLLYGDEGIMQVLEGDADKRPATRPASTLARLAGPATGICAARAAVGLATSQPKARAG
nr:hypothetical protein [Tanacetum cinerariifolium]